MPNIPMFTAPTPQAPVMQPQNAGNVSVMGVAPTSATQSYFDPNKIAAALGQNGQGSGDPTPSQTNLQNGPMALGNGQQTGQMTPQGYPMGGSGQGMTQQNFMGSMGGTGTPSYTWMPQMFGGGQ